MRVVVVVEDYPILVFVDFIIKIVLAHALGNVCLFGIVELLQSFLLLLHENRFGILNLRLSKLVLCFGGVIVNEFFSILFV